jgi:predicted XRE-type DNA-binding protein
MIKTELQSNNLDLRALLDAINNLPEKGSGGTGEDISEELIAQDALISEISLALDEVAIAQAEAFAAIGVTYPEGSTCTCSNGTKILNAKNTSGQALFLIPEAGEWTVISTATDGTETASETVEITSEGESISVELHYTVYLYKNGDEYADITGGWEKSSTAYGSARPLGTSTLTKESNQLIFDADTQRSGSINPAKDIDFTNRNTLTLSYSVSGIDGAGAAIAICKRGTANADTGSVLFAQLDASGWKNNETKTAEIDVSAISGLYNIVVVAFGTSSYWVTETLYEMALK